jgi:glycosyltransferase involved in cell wall biosynthesis
MSQIAFFTLNAYDMLTEATDSEDVGGAQLQQILVGKELASRGHDIYFIEYEKEQKQEQTVNDIKIILKPRPSGNELVRGIQALQGTLDVFRRVDPDVCYRRALDFEIVPLSILCRIMSPRFIYGIAHDNNLDDVPETLSEGIKSTRLYGRINRLSISGADAVIAQNEYQYKRAEDRLDTPVHQITNCYQPKSPEPLPEITNSNPLTVLWVSRFTSFKRPELALDIAAELPHITFIMIGPPADEQVFEEVNSRAKELDNVQLEGFVPFSEIDRYFTSADVFLNTSIEEGFPNTFLQSWAYKKPVVSLNVDPNRVFSEHEVGWVLEDSIPTAVDLLDDIADRPEYRAKVGERAYRYFVENHSIDAIVNQYEQVFTSDG